MEEDYEIEKRMETKKRGRSEGKNEGIKET